MYEDPERSHVPDGDTIMEADYQEPLWQSIMGTAGTGKTFLARRLAEEHDDILLCATTGIAAVNLGTITLNSLLWYYDTNALRINYEVGRLNAALRLYWGSGYRRFIIDEVSMMDGDQLEILCLALDEFNARRDAHDENSFGLTLVGDFAQLPPVRAPFAFQKECWQRFEANQILLTEPHRHADVGFIAALQAVRRGDVRLALDYFGPKIIQGEAKDFVGTTILGKNDEVDRHNKLRMLNLKGNTESWPASRHGQPSGEWKHIPDVLDLKAGAVVMILANKREKLEGMPPHTWPLLYANGDLGIYRGRVGGLNAARIELFRTGHEVSIEQVTRQKTKITGLKGEGRKEEILGSITYLPLRVAYASTVHKSQGLSLDNVQVLYHSQFWQQPGMLYVALSRCRTPEGLRLVGTVEQFKSRVRANPAVRRFL